MEPGNGLTKADLNKLVPNEFMLCKYSTGNAYYATKKSFWRSTASTTAPILHIISGMTYTANRSALEEVKWEDIPIDYQYDAWTNNPLIKNWFPNPVKQNNTNTSYIESLENDRNDLLLQIDEIKEEKSKILDKYTNALQVIQQQKIQQQKNEKSYEEVISYHKKEYRKLREEFAELNSTHYVLKGEYEKVKNDLLSYKTKGHMDQYLDALDDNHPSKKAYYAKKYNEAMQDLKQDNINNNIKTTEMNFSQLMPNFKFGKLETTSLALSPLGIAVKKDGSTWVVFNKETRQLVEVGDMKFDVDFYQIPVQTLSEGDWTFIDGQYLIVDHVNADGSISCIHPSSGTKTTKLSRTNIFNMYFYTKIVSMFDFMGNVAGGNTTNTPFGNINPMMFMMMGDKGGSSSSMMEMMLMSQLFNGGNTPFNFGQPQKVVEKTVKAPTSVKKTATAKPQTKRAK